MEELWVAVPRDILSTYEYSRYCSTWYALLATAPAYCSSLFKRFYRQSAALIREESSRKRAYGRKLANENLCNLMAAA